MFTCSRQVLHGEEGWGAVLNPGVEKHVQRELSTDSKDTFPGPQPLGQVWPSNPCQPVITNMARHKLLEGNLIQVPNPTLFVCCQTPVQTTCFLNRGPASELSSFTMRTEGQNRGQDPGVHAALNCTR